MKYSAYGTSLLIDGDEISQVLSISGASLSLDTVDVTSHDQANAWEEVIATVLRSGEITLELAYDPAEASHVDVLNGLVGKSAVSLELQFPDAYFTSWEFSAFVTGFEPSMPVDDKLGANVTFKVTGTPTLNSTYSP